MTRPTLPDLESLRCFVAVAERLHFRHAAEHVGLSPAAFSDRVRRLEEDVGANLLERNTRAVRLTEAGLRLLPHARALLDQAARSGQIARDEHTPLPISLTIGTRFELGQSWLCPLIPRLAQARVGRTVHLYMGDTDALIERVERGQVDAVVTSTRLSRPHLRTARLHEERYVFVGASQQIACAEDAAAHTLIDATPDLPLARYLLDALPDGARWRFAAHLYMGGIGGIRLQVLAGLGVAVLPEYFVEADLSAGRLRRLLPHVTLPPDWFRLVWRADHPREPELERLAAELAAHPLS